MSTEDLRMKALVLVNKGNAKLITDRPVPAVRPGFLLVKTLAIALNPADWRTIDSPQPAANALLGSDFSGIVLEVGAGRDSHRWKKGDRVFGCIPGGSSKDPELGAFAEIILAEQEVCMHPPEDLSNEDAATIGLSLLTVGQGLFYGMNLELPELTGQRELSEYLLIYGGSTSAGTLAIQLATRAGYKVLAVCSSKNADLARSRGALAVFDYHDDDCAKQIYDYTNGNLKLVWDTIGETEAVASLCMNAMSKAPGGKYGTINFHNIPRKDVVHSRTNLRTCFGEDFQIPGKVHLLASEDEAAYIRRFVGLMEKLIQAGQLKTHPADVRDGGLDNVLGGLELLRGWQVSGKKLVYRMAVNI